MIHSKFSALLQCPPCGETLRFQKLGKWRGACFGILHCRAHRYPVVFDIVICLTRPPTLFALSLLEQKRFEEALLVMLAGALPKKTGGFVRRRERARRLLFSKSSTFRSALSLLPRWRKYFLRYFSIPAFLIQKVLSETVLRGRGAFLDLCSGPGQLAWALGRMRINRSLVCLDQLFYFLFFARRFLPTRALYVCADASAPFPFRTNVFSSILCSSAFDDILRKSVLVKEVMRTLKRDGTLAVTDLKTDAQSFFKNHQVATDGTVKTKLYSEKELLQEIRDSQIFDLFSKRRDLNGMQSPFTLIVSRNPKCFKRYRLGREILLPPELPPTYR